MSMTSASLKALLSEHSLDELRHLIRREKARKSLAAFCQYVDPSYQLASHNLKLIAALEKVERGECKRLMVSMPPRHSKSETSTINFPTWYLGKHPERDIIIAANATELAETFSRKARAKFEEHASNLFGVRIAGDSHAAGRWGIQRKPGGVLAVGVGTSLPGRGAHLLVIDDPIKNAEAAASETNRKKIIEWYQTDARTRLAPSGAVVVVATRYHEEDLIGHLIATEREGGEAWECINLGMVDGAGRMLWPERFGRDFDADAEGRPDPERLKQFILAVGTSTWESLYQGRPSPEEGDIFKKQWWKRFKEAPPVCERRAISVDCTFKETNGSDFVTFGVWDRVRANKYLRCQVRARLSFVDTLATLRRLVATWKPHEILIEDKANGPAVISAARGTIPGIIAIDPHGGKVVRARAVSAEVEAGNVWLPESSVGWEGPAADGDPVEAFINECAGFPNTKHDDQVDQMTQLLNRWRGADGKDGVVTAGTRPAPRGLEM